MGEYRGALERGARVLPSTRQQEHPVQSLSAPSQRSSSAKSPKSWNTILGHMFKAKDLDSALLCFTLGDLVLCFCLLATVGPAWCSNRLTETQWQPSDWVIKGSFACFGVATVVPGRQTVATTTTVKVCGLMAASLPF